jgi:hypothetical protein
LFDFVWVLRVMPELLLAIVCAMLAAWVSRQRVRYSLAAEVDEEKQGKAQSTLNFVAFTVFVALLPYGVLQVLTGDFLSPFTLAAMVLMLGNFACWADFQDNLDSETANCRDSAKRLYRAAFLFILVTSIIHVVGGVVYKSLVPPSVSSSFPKTEIVAYRGVPGGDYVRNEVKTELVGKARLDTSTNTKRPSQGVWYVWAERKADGTIINTKGLRSEVQVVDDLSVGDKPYVVRRSRLEVLDTESARNHPITSSTERPWWQSPNANIKESSIVIHVPRGTAGEYVTDSLDG